MNKYLAISAAALFLFAAPATSFALETGGSGTASGSGSVSGGGTTAGGSGTVSGGGTTDAGGGTGGGTSDTGGNAGAGTGGGTTGGSTDSNTANTTTNQQSGGNECSDVGPGTQYDKFTPKCRDAIDAWAKAQTGASVVYSGDVAVGTVLPDTVTVVEVPAYTHYGYAYLNDHRVLVDRDTHTVVYVY